MLNNRKTNVIEKNSIDALGLQLAAYKVQKEAAKFLEFAYKFSISECLLKDFQEYFIGEMYAERANDMDYRTRMVGVLESIAKIDQFLKAVDQEEGTELVEFMETQANEQIKVLTQKIKNYADSL